MYKKDKKLGIDIQLLLDQKGIETPTYKKFNPDFMYLFYFWAYDR